MHCSGPSGELARLAVSTLSLKYFNLVTARILNKKRKCATGLACRVEAVSEGTFRAPGGSTQPLDL